MSQLYRKQIVLLTIFMAIFLPVFAQKKIVYNDVAPFSGSSQFRKFSIGINAGVMNPSVILGGTNDFANPQYTLGYGANIHYQVNHYLAIQADFLRGKLKGNQNDKFGAGRPVSSFKTDVDWAVSLSAVLTAGNVNWLSKTNKVIPYISAGIGYIGYSTKIIKAGTTNEIDYVDNNSSKNPLFVPVEAGLKINLSRVINLDLGYRMNFVDADNVDGLPYYNYPANSSSTFHKDKFSYTFVGLEFSLGNKTKPQLLFDNPAARVNNYLQKQVDTVKTNVDTVKANQEKMMKDSDGDGVPDMFDKEPNTPNGCPVDVNGITRDTDGDGVPDCKDKELVTPTQCQPVDADGVGKCPDPECCKNRVDSNVCNIGDLPSISFHGNNTRLSSDAKAMLATIGTKMKSNAECSISVTGYPAASKASQALCNKRLELIKTFLSESEGISVDRIETNCEVGGGDSNTVDIKSK